MWPGALHIVDDGPRANRLVGLSGMMKQPPSAIAPAQARLRQQQGVLLIDVRSPDERALGMADGAIGVDQATLLHDPARHIPAHVTPVLLLCQTGARSANCASALMALGYHAIESVSGGTEAWQSAGLPMGRSELDTDFGERYSRQLRLPDVGLEGQHKLERASVLIVGAGGLGSPAAMYLAAAGIGTLRIADADVVDRSNLQRQILHTDARIGMAKVESAAIAISALNPRTRVEPIPEQVDADNIERMLAGIDVVVDGSDNFPTRYLLNDACVRLGKPLVYGAVQRFDGQVSVFDAGRQRGQSPCYRCLYPQPPPADAVPNCSDAGVLGVLPGVIGMLQATEVVKLVLGIGESLSGRLLQFDARTMRFHELRIQADPECPVCATESACL